MSSLGHQLAAPRAECAFGHPLRPFRFSATARTILPEDELLDIMGGAFITLHERAALRAGKRRFR